MRPIQFWIYVSIYCGVVAILLFINYSLFEYQEMFDNNLYSLNKSLYYQFLALEIVMLIIWAAFNSASAISSEKKEKTYDFFKGLPLTASQKMLGIFIGKNLVVLLLSVLNFSLIIFYAIKAEVTITFHLQTILLLFVTAVLANAIGLLGGTSSSGKPNKTSKVGIIVLILFLGPFIFQGLFAISLLDEIRDTKALFYNLEIPVLLMSAFVIAYFSFWMIIAGLRKLKNDDMAALRKTQVYFYYLGYVAIIYGLFYPYFKDWDKELRGAIFMLTLLPALVNPFWSLSNYDGYLETSGSNKKSRKISVLRLIWRSNLTLYIGHFIIWTCVILLVECQTSTRSVLPQMIGVLFTFLIVLILIMEVMMVCSGTNKIIGLLLTFIVGVYIAIPPIAGAIFEEDTLYLHSPGGFVFGFLSEWHLEPALLADIAAVNLLLSIVPLLVVARQYTIIISTRRRLSYNKNSN